MWISVELSKSISLATNAVIVYGCFVAAYWSFCRIKEDRRLTKKLQPGTRRLIWGLLLWTIGEFVRIGWWIPPQILSSTGQYYADFANEWKWIVYMPAASLILIGITQTIRELEGKDYRWEMLTISKAVLFAIACITLEALV